MGKTKKKSITYAVQRKLHGTTKDMLVTRSYKKAAAYYHAHPNAKYIQKYRGSRYGLTAGQIQPGTPNTIRYRRKKYKRVYVGPHPKRSAKQLANGLRKSSVIKGAVARHFKKGWFVFVRS